MSHQELRYPHEAPLELLTAARKDPLHYLQPFLSFGYDGLVLRAERGGDARALQGAVAVRKIFQLFNGHTHGAELSDKATYAYVMQGAGYEAPRTTEVRPTDGAREAAERVAALDPNDSRRFLKLRFGRQARYSMQANDPEHAVALAKSAKLPYLVQSLELPNHEWRYMLHRDPTQVSEGAPHGWRLAFKKRHASFTGDGQQTLRELVRSQNLPITSRLKFALHKGKDLDRVPQAGEHVEFAIGGNVSVRHPGKTELANLDRFMTRLAQDLETSIGAPLATICFDLGVRAVDSLTRPYSHERLRRELIFYEYQLPFSFVDYSLQARREHRKDGREIPPLLQMARGGLGHVALMSSMHASGRAMRRLIERQ